MKPRVVVIDLLRLVALVEMINGHTLNVVLSEDIKSTEGFATFTWFRGLVSVAFMLASGLSFHLTTVSRLDRHRADPTGPRHRIRRALEIIAIGYVLRFPTEVFFGDFQAFARGLDRFLAVDVLQAIGLSLILLELFAMTFKRAWQVQLAAAFTGTLAIVLAPLGDALSARHVWPLLTNYVGHAGGSLFPLAPWSAYVLLGVVVGGIVLPQGAATPLRTYVSRLALLGAIAWGGARLLAHSPFTLWYPGLSYSSRPYQVISKFGVVLGATALLGLLFAPMRALPRIAQILAGETLAVYVFHLVVLYWTHWSIYARLRNSLDLSQGLMVSAALLVASVLVGFGWHQQKQLRARWRAQRASAGASDESVPQETTS
jgi:uncharacterized membrane protein